VDLIEHHKTYDNSLIIKIIGLHKIRIGGKVDGNYIRLLIMNNVFPNSVEEIYNLKGSTTGRESSKKSKEKKIFKDLDILEKQKFIEIDKKTKEEFHKQISIDCQVYLHNL
jgi:hypothetical protein